MTLKYFKDKKPNHKKLIGYGFVEFDNGYLLEKRIFDGDMSVTVEIKDETINTTVTDLLMEEEYVLHKIPDAKGEFVGRVRGTLDELLLDISERCYDSSVFVQFTTLDVISHVFECYGDRLEFLWETSPDCAIFRRKDTGKWYGVIMKVPLSKFGIDDDTPFEILNLHVSADEIDKIVDGKHIFYGYHMNKRHWISVLLDGVTDFNYLKKLIFDSYLLAKKK